MLTTGLRCSRLVLAGKEGMVKVRCKLQDLAHRSTDVPEGDRAFVQAKERLHKLLSGVQSPEQELVEQMFQELPRDERLILLAQVAGVFVVSSLVLSAICRVDPLGGFNVLHPEVNHLLYGLGAAAPLILVRTVLRSDAAPSFIQEYVARKREEALLFFKHFSLSDAMMAASMLSFSVSFLVFPGLIGSMASSVKTYSTYFIGSDGTGHAFHGALLFVAGLLGVTSGASLTLCREEAEVVKAAVENSDRYYRLTTPLGRSSYSAQHHSEAFRRASFGLLEDNRQACIFAAVLTFVETYYGGMLWKMTGDASTTICLFICIAMAEMIQLKSEKS